MATDSTSNSTNRRGNFGFNFKAGAKGPQGNSVYVYRMRMDVKASSATAIVSCSVLGGTCRDVNVIIRSNKLTALSAGNVATYPISGFATGQIAVQFVDAMDGMTHYSGFEFGGGTFRIDVTDTSNGGSSDTYGLTAYRKDVTVFHQAFTSGPIAQTGTGAPTNQAPLGGGNITVHPR